MTAEWAFLMTVLSQFLPAQVITPCQFAKLDNGSIEQKDFYGISVAADGDVAVVGADMFPTTGRGYAQVYRRNGIDWVHEQTLYPPQPQNFDFFGRHVSADGGTLLIGCAGRNSVNVDAGAAYIFRYTGDAWIQVQELISPDPDTGDTFGFGVGIDADVAIVGAPYDDEGGTNGGAAYIFRFNGTAWILEQKLLPEDSSPESYFGYTVDISGNIAVVGPAWDHDGGNNAGAVYVFRYDGATWMEEQKLLSPHPHADEVFGRQLAVSGNRILVGNPIELIPPHYGRAYVFFFSDGKWSLEQELLGQDTDNRDGFGTGVDIRDNVLVVSAAGEDASNPADLFCNSGAAYVFRHDGDVWTQTTKLLAEDIGCKEALGSSEYHTVSLSGTLALIGAPGSDDACPTDPNCSSGAAYIFAIDGDCNNNSIVDACEIQDGMVEDTDDDLIPDDCPVMSFAGVATMLVALSAVGGLIVSARLKRLPSQT